MNLVALLFATVADVHRWGWLSGLGAGAALYVLMPYHPKAQ